MYWKVFWKELSSALEWLQLILLSSFSGSSTWHRAWFFALYASGLKTCHTTGFHLAHNLVLCVHAQGCCPDAWLLCFPWLTLTWHPSNIWLMSEWKLVLVLLGLLVLLSIWFQVKTGTNFTTKQLQMKQNYKLEKLLLYISQFWKHRQQNCWLLNLPLRLI